MTDAVERLRAAGVDNPRLDARLLWEFACNNPTLEGGSKFAQQISGRGSSWNSKLDPSPKNPLDFSTLPQGEGRQAEGGVEERFESYLRRRIAREPVAYILGRKEFWSIDFAVGPGALIPRPETETLVEQVLKRFPDRDAALDVLDLGTGTGCLLGAVLREYRNARGTGIDSSPQALAWARRNLEGRAELIPGDFADAGGAYDVILSNPPYIRTQDIRALAPEIRLYEPAGALDGGPDGLDAYRALAPLVRRILKPDGQVFLEIGMGQGEAVARLLGGKTEIVADLAGVPRCVIGEKSLS